MGAGGFLRPLIFGFPSARLAQRHEVAHGCWFCLYIVCFSAHITHFTHTSHAFLGLHSSNLFFLLACFRQIWDFRLAGLRQFWDLCLACIRLFWDFCLAFARQTKIQKLAYAGQT